MARRATNVQRNLRRDIADYLGLTIATVSRMMAQRPAVVAPHRPAQLTGFIG
jgi:CRP-like cAMP-binding protein